MLTSRGRRTIAFGLVAGLGGRILGVPELFGLAAAVVVVTLAALVAFERSEPTVSVSARAVPDIVAMGEPATLELTDRAVSVWRISASAIVLAHGPNPGAWSGSA